MTKRYKLAILIGRFEPFHNGHLSNAKQAGLIADEVHMLVGSSYQPRTPKNPFTYYERASMIRSALSTELGDDSSRYTTSPLPDFKYSNNSWIAHVQASIAKTYHDVADSDICILGYDKDESSWYNHAFPEWKFISLEGFVEHGSTPIDATKVRELYFEGHLDFLQGTVPNAVFDFLKEFKTREYYTNCVEEYDFYKAYKKAWSVAPYCPTFQTVDACVVQGGHILLIQRGFAPGRGLWALPGGFLNPKEELVNGAIRELIEETKLKVPEVVLRKSITYNQRFDHPDRDLRGRVITEAFLIELDGGNGELPRVKGSDDAKKAKWFKLSEVEEMGEFMYGDHAHIIQTMVARAKK